MHAEGGQERGLAVLNRRKKSTGSPGEYSVRREEHWGLASLKPREGHSKERGVSPCHVLLVVKTGGTAERYELA